MKVAPMRMPDSLATLLDYGIIQEVIRPLMSGKEAQVYLVVSEGEQRVAKVYKEAEARTFKHRAEYTEGRKTRNTRDQRAMSKRTRHGRAKDEAAWRSTEVDMIHRLSAAGVRVPEPHQFIDGVLIMELVKDAAGGPAKRLGDLSFEPAEALEIYEDLIAQVVRMLCAGVVHGDLSEFNVLMGSAGPTLIDFPQSIDPASNQNARRLLLRDVDNLHRFAARFAPAARRPAYAEEMWDLYQGNRLKPSTRLRGAYRAPDRKTDTAEVLALIGDAREEESARREARGEAPVPDTPRPRRTVVDLSEESPNKRPARRSAASSARPASAGSPSRGGEVAARRRRPATSRADGRAGAAPVEDAGGRAAKEERGRRTRKRRPKRSNAQRGAGSAGPQREPDGGAARKRGRPERREAGSADGAVERDSGSGQAPRPAKKRGRRRRRPAARGKDPRDG